MESISQLTNQRLLDTQLKGVINEWQVSDDWLRLNIKNTSTDFEAWLNAEGASNEQESTDSRAETPPTSDVARGTAGNTQTVETRANQ